MRKIKYSKILTLIIGAYIIFQVGVNFVSKSIDTTVVENEKIDAKISTKGILIREENVIYSNTYGELELLVEEGEKIKKSQKIAQIYSNETDSSLVKEIETLSQEIDDMKSGANNISKDDIYKLNQEIESLSDKIQTNLLESKNIDIDIEKQKVNSLIEERNRLLNNSIDSKKLETKENEKQVLSNKLNKNQSTLHSNISGVVSYKFDGSEETYNLDKLYKLTKKDINNTQNNYEQINQNEKNIKENQPILRVINANNCYLAVCVEKEQSKFFEINKSVKLNYNKYNIDAKVDKIYQDKNNMMVIFKISNQNIGIYDTRVEEFDIIYKQIDGLKIPKSAVEIVDDKKGVYVVNQETKKMEFILLDGVSYENEEFLFIDYYNNNIKGIKSVDLYDEIVLKPNIISKNIKIK